MPWQSALVGTITSSRLLSMRVTAGWRMAVTLSGRFRSRLCLLLDASKAELLLDAKQKQFVKMHIACYPYSLLAPLALSLRRAHANAAPSRHFVTV